MQIFRYFFFRSDSNLGLTDLVKHSINTGNTKPIKQPPRRVPLAYAGEERKITPQMEENGIIRKSTPPWASPFCLVLKKNGKIRLQGIECSYKFRCFPTSKSTKLLRRCCLSQVFFHIWPNFWLPSSIYGRKKHPKDCLFDQVWLVRVSFYAVWTFKRTCNIPKTDGIGTLGSAMENCLIN